MRRLDLMPPTEGPPPPRSWGVFRFALSFSLWFVFLLLAISMFTR
jgi:hypothetical protein